MSALLRRSTAVCSLLCRVSNTFSFHSACSSLRLRALASSALTRCWSISSSTPALPMPSSMLVYMRSKRASRRLRLRSAVARWLRSYSSFFAASSASFTRSCATARSGSTRPLASVPRSPVWGVRLLRSQKDGPVLSRAETREARGSDGGGGLGGGNGGSAFSSSAPSEDEEGSAAISRSSSTSAAYTRMPCPDAGRPAMAARSCAPCPSPTPPPSASPTC